MKSITIEQRFKEYILEGNLFGQNDRLLLAVSGGVDSIALCQLCHINGFTFEIAHCNFNLRGEESRGDADFVKDLALRYSVPYHQIEFDTASYAENQNLSIQVAARQLRYDWFMQLMESSTTRLRYLLTAHHADDNVETILMNFFKGTGIGGLKGIMPIQGKLVRPLLFARKDDILQYALDKGLSYRDDSSNNLDKYTRNYFRNNLIPSLEKVFPAVTENLAANAERFRDIKRLYDESIERHLKKLLVKKGEEVHVPVLRLKHLPAKKTLLFEIIRDYGFSSAQTSDVMTLLDSETGKYVNSPTHRIYRYNKWLIISALQNNTTGSFLIEENDTELQTKGFILKISVQSTAAAIDRNSEVAMIDIKHLSYPLIVRKWKTGDYFYPLGMRKKKKVGRFLSDEKLTLNEKENTWVIESGRKIIWIVGRRIDDRFKITERTQQLLKIDRRPAK